MGEGGFKSLRSSLGRSLSLSPRVSFLFSTMLHRWVELYPFFVLSPPTYLSIHTYLPLSIHVILPKKTCIVLRSQRMDLDILKRISRISLTPEEETDISIQHSSRDRTLDEGSLSLIGLFLMDKPFN